MIRVTIFLSLSTFKFPAKIFRGAVFSSHPKVGPALLNPTTKTHHADRWTVRNGKTRPSPSRPEHSFKGCKATTHKSITRRLKNSFRNSKPKFEL
jgi:hypothetical protein